MLEQVVQLLDAHPGRRMGGRRSGKNRAVAMAARRSAATVSNSISSPFRCRSSSSSSSDSSMIDSISGPRRSSIRAASSASGGAHDGRAVAVVGDGAPQQVDQPGQAAVGEQRDLDRLGVTEHAPAARDGLVEVAAGLLQLGDRHGPGHPGHLALPPQQPGGLVDVPTGRDHEQHRVGGAQPGAHLADEVRMARGVEQVDVDVAARHRGRLQRRGSSRLPAHVPARRTRGDEPLEQRALARPGGPDEDDVADLLRSGRPDRPGPVGFNAHCSTFSAPCGEGKTCSITNDPIQK